MEIFNVEELKKLYRPPANSHKGQNGKLLVIGGSHLFHASFLWSLTIASRIVDMLFYSSVPENNQIVAEAKREFRNGIVVPRDDLDRYASEADVIMIGPGMLRAERETMNYEQRTEKLKEINELKDEGEQAYYLTKYLLEKYPKKKWIIDAGALQMIEPEWLLPLEGRVVLTPHGGEFEGLESRIKNQELRNEIKNKKIEKQVELFSREYKCIVLLKGQEDVVCSANKCIKVAGGNAGMTKGGTGDVLAGLVGALACNNDLWLSATAASYINKKAGDSLFEKVGYYFNSSDLADEIPRVMAELLL
jgi:NAD(P)H-hydrate epimerase